MFGIFSKRAGGIFGIISPIIALVFIAISIYLNPWFVWADNALSDLGAVGESYNFVYNSGMVLSGSFGILFSVVLRKICVTRFGFFGVFAFGLGMFFLALVGFFPSGYSPHMFVSIAFFSLTTIALIIVGIDQVWVEETRPWGIFTLSLTLTGIIAILLTQKIPYSLEAAIPEFIGAIVYIQFSLIFGIRLTTKQNKK